MWRVGTLIKSELVAEKVKAMTFSVEPWVKHQAGQYYDLRLTSEDGYQAIRSYSVASAPKNNELEFGIELLENGEVSPYLFEMQPGDQLELRGPLGDFGWDEKMDGDLVMIAGGTGMVPEMSMLRHYIEIADKRVVRFLISARSLDKVLYRDELESLAKQNDQLKVLMTLTGEQPKDWSGYSRRVDVQMLEEVLEGVNNPRIYICGPTSFVSGVENLLIEMGYPADRIKIESFG